MKKFLYLLIVLFTGFQSKAQQHKPQNDTLSPRQLDSVVIITKLRESLQKPLPVVKGTYLFDAKKTESITLDKLDVNRVDNNPRQLFSKIPGVFVYEDDGSGNQVNISFRGLDPHRSWETNVRHNDVMTNSDIYGYPASHYNPPTESIERIEVVHGSGALQYGAQFGGMLNYITKRPDTTRKFSFESQNSAGSYGLFSTYNAIGGRVGKLTYMGYVNYRSSHGYRDNSDYHYFATHGDVEYAFNSKLNLRLEFNSMSYVNHINGGLTDEQFHEDPTQATRERNYYSPTIYVPSVRLDYKIGKRTSLNFISSAILGSRNSVQFIALSTVKDTFNTSLASYNPRQVDIDNYHSYSNELRMLHSFTVLKLPQTFVAGVRYINNDLHRQQLGKGTTGFDYDLSLINPVWGRDLHFKTKNISLFVEDMINITSKLSLTAGMRFENGGTHMSGTISYYNPEELPVKIDHHFTLLGVGAQYAMSSNINVYANWSQAYRPVIFADLIPATVLNKNDPNIKDAFGNNSELGIRGRLGNAFNFDFTVFNLNYFNRTGNVILTDDNNQTYFYKTNTGNSNSKGFELYAEVQPIKWLSSYNSSFRLNLFTSTAYINARYTKKVFLAGTNMVDIKGNWVEAAPHFISRNGVQVAYKKFSSTLQYSFTGKAYADALNTEKPNASGTLGVVPSYSLVDWNFTYYFGKRFNVKLLMNNLLNKQYFTERPWFFPGPGGLYPADGRSIIVSAGIRL